MHKLLIVAAALPLLVAGCVGRPHLAPIAATPEFDPIAFFSGHTEGRGSLRKILSHRYATVVHGIGTVRDGTLVLDQTVVQGAKPPKHREWHIWRVGPGRYAGTLSDAPGGLTGDATGNRLHLAFTMKGGLATEQWLTLAPDGRSAHNVMVVHKLGLRAAVLEEEIRKTD
jgi:hypothetical protein